MAAHQAPPSLGFSRQEHWSGLPFPSPMHESEKWMWSCSVVSDLQRPHALQPSRFRPWDFPGKTTGVGCHCLLPALFSLKQKCQHLFSLRPYFLPRGSHEAFLLSSDMSGPWRSQTETISCYCWSLVNTDTPAQTWGRVKEWGKGFFFIDLPLHAASCHYHVPNTTLSKLDQNSVFSSYTF